MADRLLWTGKNIIEAVEFFERTGGFYFRMDGSVDLNWGADRAYPGDWVRFDADGDDGIGAFVVEGECAESDACGHS